MPGYTWLQLCVHTTVKEGSLRHRADKSQYSGCIAHIEEWGKDPLLINTKCTQGNDYHNKEHGGQIKVVEEKEAVVQEIAQSPTVRIEGEHHNQSRIIWTTEYTKSVQSLGISVCIYVS